MTPPHGRLLLIPAPLEQVPDPRPWLCEPDRRLAGSLARYYVETPKTARTWLKALPTELPLQALQLRALPPVDAQVDWNDWLAPARTSVCYPTRAAQALPTRARGWSLLRTTPASRCSR